MSENWRPENWEEIKREYMGYGTRYALAFEGHSYDGAFEAGFDACLAELYERAGKEGKQWFKLTEENDSIVIYMD